MSNNVLIKNKKGYKKTKLGWIPEEWDLLKLGDFFTLTSGITKPDDLHETQECNDNPVYGGNGVIGYSKQVLLNQKVLIIGRVGEKCGCVHYLQTPCWITDNALYINSIKKNFNYEYMYYLLQKINLNKYRNKSGQPLISQKPIYCTIIAMPKIAEQEKIVEILSAWDDGIETLEKLIEQKEILKNSLAQKCFRRKNILFPLKQHKLGELFKNRKETNCCDLELLSVCDGLGIVPRSQLNAKDNSNENKSKYLKVCIGDLAYNTMRMWQGRCGVSSYEGIVSPAYTVCIPKNNIDVDYMYYLFKTPHMIHDFWRYSQGIVDDTLNLKFNNFEVIKVWIPDKETQTKIAKLLKSYDEELQLLNSKLEKLKEQKKGLMQKLLTGQIRVKV